MFQNNSFEWAFSARKKFYESLSNVELKSLFEAATSKNVIITVFGKSQVGKTTLILKLSGISSEYFDIVSKTLRGGSPPGSPCSPTAIIYKQSDDNNYYYSESGSEKREKADDNEMCKILKKLRANVEKGKYTNLEMVEIHIPKKYYTISENNLKITIIDLPGYGSSIKEEHAHTEKLFKKYLPLSSLRLLVENANNIVSLENINKGNRNAVDWQYQPEVYRVVLTRSASAESATKEILKHKLFKKDDLLKFYTDIFNNKLINVPKDVKIYPLEYGESWKEQKKNNSKLFNICDPIFEDLLNNLRKDIIDSADPVYQLVTFSRSQKAIDKIKKDKLIQFSNKLDKLEIDLRKVEDLILKTEDLIDIHEKEKKSETKKFENINSCPDFKFNDISFPNEKEKVSILKKYLIEFETEIINQVNIYLQNIEITLPSCNNVTKGGKNKISLNENINYLLGENLNPQYKLLGSYFLDDYWREAKWKEDKKSIIYCCNNTKKEIIEVLKEELATRIDDHYDIYEKKINKMEKQKVKLETYSKENISQLNKLQETKRSLKKEEKQFEVLIKQDEDNTKKYFKFFEEEYKQTFKDKWQELNKTDNVYSKISNLVELVKINYEFYKLFKLR